MEEIYTNKFFSALVDRLRNCGIQKLESALMALLILAWIKLSQDNDIPEEIALNHTNKPSTIKELNSVLNRLTKFDKLGYKKYAFDLCFVQDENLNISTAINMAIEFKQDFIVKEFNIHDFSIQILTSRILEGTTPVEVAKLMVALGGNLTDKTVYCPWDVFSSFASLANAKGAKSSIESHIHTVIPSLVNIFKNTNVEIFYSDPIICPKFKFQDRLQKFDITICFPPFGTRYEPQINEMDWLNRFPEKTMSGDVMHLRHIISQTKDKAIIAVPNRLLFSSGAEQLMRKYLLEKKQIEAVISLPPALLFQTTIPFSITIVNLQHESSNVSFVNGNDERFFLKDGKGRAKLENWQLLLDIIRKDIDKSCIVKVPIEDIISNNYCLEVSQYASSPEKQKTNWILQKSHTKTLNTVVNILRPPIKQRVAENTEIENVLEAVEVTIGDFPGSGYVRNPTRIVKLALESKTEYFLEPGDILIAVKANSGKVAIVPEVVTDKKNRPWIANQSCLMLRCIKNQIDPKVLFMYLTSEMGRYLLRSITSGATIPIIQLARLKEIKIIIPTEKERDKLISNFDRLVELQSQLESIQQEQEQIGNSCWNFSDN